MLKLGVHSWSLTYSPETLVQYWIWSFHFEVPFCGCDQLWCHPTSQGPTRSGEVAWAPLATWFSSSSMWLGVFFALVRWECCVLCPIGAGKMNRYLRYHLKTRGNATGIAGKKRRLCTSFVKMNMGVVWSSWSHVTIRFWTASTASILSSRNMLKCSVFQHVKLVITTLTSNRIRLSTIFKHLLGFPLYLKFQPVLMCFNAFFLVAPKWCFCNVFVIS